MSTSRGSRPSAGRAYRFEVLVAGNAAEAGPRVGTRLGVFSGDCLIGRAGHCDVQLDHPTVSYEHVTIAPEGGGLAVRSRAANGSTFVAAEPVEPGRDARLPPDAPFVQVGGFLLEVRMLERTRPHEAPLPLPESGTPDPLLAIDIDPHRGSCRVNGRSLSLPPKLHLLLAALATYPNKAVPRDVLVDAVAPDQAWANLDPLVHRLRHALDEFADQSPHVAATVFEAVVDGREASLGRSLVQTVRGQGYRLALAAGDVRVVTRGGRR